MLAMLQDCLFIACLWSAACLFMEATMADFFPLSFLLGYDRVLESTLSVNKMPDACMHTKYIFPNFCSTNISNFNLIIVSLHWFWTVILCVITSFKTALQADEDDDNNDFLKVREKTVQEKVCLIFLWQYNNIIAMFRSCFVRVTFDYLEKKPKKLFLLPTDGRGESIRGLVERAAGFEKY